MNSFKELSNEEIMNIEGGINWDRIGAGFTEVCAFTL
jgi:bacteriocin-like protein